MDNSLFYILLAAIIFTVAMIILGSDRDKWSKLDECKQAEGCTLNVHQYEVWKSRHPERK